MELGTAAYNPQIQRVLKSFQSAAMDSLRGPSGYSSTWFEGNKLSPSDLEEYRKALMRVMSINKREDIKPLEIAPAPAMIQGPVFLPMDTSSEKSEAILEGETIACFKVGGEKRLCLPQILQSVLRKFSMDAVQEACSDLHIFLSRCNPEQLQKLKFTGNLPQTAPSCGLITKTDAERLCNKLLHSNPDRYLEPPTPNSFKVYHECFGKCKGIFHPELYSHPEAHCIQCTDCKGLFSPHLFVGHCHKALENRTCHWGFDPANWRSYLLLAKDQDNREGLQVYLEDIKSRFDHDNTYKRKEPPHYGTDEGYKKMRRTDGDYGDAPAFRPWSPNSAAAAASAGTGRKYGGSGSDGGENSHPFLHKGPPKLLNPERVIPYTDQQCYERHFAPNVSLAPAPPKKLKLEPDDDDEPTPVSSRRPMTPSVAPRRSVTPGVGEAMDTDSNKSEASSSSTLSAGSCDLPRSEDLSAWRAAELALFRRALRAGTWEDGEDQALLEEFVALRRRTDVALERLVEATKDLQMEAVDAAERRRVTEAQLSTDIAATTAALARKRQQLDEVRGEYSRRLAAREEQYAEMHGEMLKELHWLRAELRRRSSGSGNQRAGTTVVVPDINYDLELMGDCPTFSTPPPQSPPTGPQTQSPATATALQPGKEAEGRASTETSDDDNAVESSQTNDNTVDVRAEDAVEAGSNPGKSELLRSEEAQPEEEREGKQDLVKEEPEDVDNVEEAKS